MKLNTFQILNVEIILHRKQEKKIEVGSAYAFKGQSVWIYSLTSE